MVAQPMLTYPELPAISRLATGFAVVPDQYKSLDNLSTVTISKRVIKKVTCKTWDIANYLTS
jgi:hypothetical protein